MTRSENARISIWDTVLFLISGIVFEFLGFRLGLGRLEKVVETTLQGQEWHGMDTAMTPFEVKIGVLLILCSLPTIWAMARAYGELAENERTHPEQYLMFIDSPVLNAFLNFLGMIILVTVGWTAYVYSRGLPLYYVLLAGAIPSSIILISGLLGKLESRFKPTDRQRQVTNPE